MTLTPAAARLAVLRGQSRNVLTYSPVRGPVPQSAECWLYRDGILVEFLSLAAATAMYDRGEARWPERGAVA